MGSKKPKRGNSERVAFQNREGQVEAARESPRILFFTTHHEVQAVAGCVILRTIALFSEWSGIYEQPDTGKGSLRQMHIQRDHGVRA